MPGPGMMMMMAMRMNTGKEVLRPLFYLNEEEQIS
jgi:hypothetical protein